jgi:hypothetical protein
MKKTSLKSKTKTLLTSTLSLKRPQALLVVLLFVTVGVAVLYYSHAASLTNNAEAEKGTIAGAATVVSDSNASGGQAVRFGGDSTTTPTPTPTLINTPTPTSTPVAGGAGGICNSPFASTSVARGDINIGTNGLFQVRNEAWNDSHGPQTIFACSEQSWYVTSNQPNNGGQVETYPDSLYSISGSKTIPQYTSITSTFGEAYQKQGDWNAAYDLWVNNWGTEVMIWNEWNGGPGYWATQAKTAVSLGGVPYHFYNNGGELMFFRDTQVKSGSVDILAAYKWLVTQNLLKSTDVPTQIEYGVEICGTAGQTMRFDTTAFTVSLK